MTNPTRSRLIELSHSLNGLVQPRSSCKTDTSSMVPIRSATVTDKAVMIRVVVELADGAGEGPVVGGRHEHAVSTVHQAHTRREQHRQGEHRVPGSAGGPSVPAIASNATSVAVSNPSPNNAPTPNI